MQDGTGIVKKFSSLKTLMEGDLFQRYFRETQKENSVIVLFFNDLHGMAKSGTLFGTFSRGVVPW